MRLQDGQCRSRAMGRCPVLLKDKWTTSKVPSKNSNRRRRNLKASSDLSTSEASLEQEFNGRTMRRTFHSSAIWRKFDRYMRMYYVGSHPAMAFPPTLWNVHERSLNNLPRTSNSIESSHRKLERCVRNCYGRRELLLSDLIKTLKEEAQAFKNDMLSLSNNPLYKISHRRKLKDVKKDQRIMKVLDYAPIPPQLPLTGLEFLKAIRSARKYT
uniref:Uncharacterized protein n=1 Tax=Caenorhabditis japonica TaxID=281687 RepID=A0A8R1J1D8_CAEJA